MLADQGERPLLQPKRGAFFDTDLGPLRMTPERGEYGHVGIDPQRIIAPVAGDDHATIEVEDAGELASFKSGDWAPVPLRRERRDDAQALLTLGWG